MTIYVSLLVALVGLIAYAISNNGKVMRLGEILMFCGTFVFLLMLAGERTTLLR